MKGQSSIEYLVTYGWMLAAVGLVSGAVYGSGYVNFCSDDVSGMQLQPLEISNFGVAGGEELQIAFQNNDPQSFDYLVKEVEIVDRDTGETIVYSPSNGDGFVVEGGEEDAVSVPGVSDEVSCGSFDIELRYDRGDALPDQEQTGTLQTGMSIEEEIEQRFELDGFQIAIEEDEGDITEDETYNLEFSVINEGETDIEERIEAVLEEEEEGVVEEFVDEDLSLSPGGTENFGYSEQLDEGDYTYSLESDSDIVLGEFTVWPEDTIIIEDDEPGDIEGEEGEDIVIDDNITVGGEIETDDGGSIFTGDNVVLEDEVETDEGGNIEFGINATVSGEIESDDGGNIEAGTGFESSNDIETDDGGDLILEAEFFVDGDVDVDGSGDAFLGDDGTITGDLSIDEGTVFCGDNVEIMGSGSCDEDWNQ